MTFSEKLQTRITEKATYTAASKKAHKAHVLESDLKRLSEHLEAKFLLLDNELTIDPQNIVYKKPRVPNPVILASRSARGEQFPSITANDRRPRVSGIVKINKVDFKITPFLTAKSRSSTEVTCSWALSPVQDCRKFFRFKINSPKALSNYFSLLETK